MKNNKKFHFCIRPLPHCGTQANSADKSFYLRVLRAISAIEKEKNVIVFNDYNARQFTVCQKLFTKKSISPFVTPKASPGDGVKTKIPSACNTPLTSELFPGIHSAQWPEA